MDQFFLVLVVVLVALQVGDVVTTLKVLDRGGREMNPAIRLSMRLFGSKAIGLIVPKMAFLGLLIFLAPVLVPIGWAVLAVAALCALYVWVLVNNLRVLRS